MGSDATAGSATGPRVADGKMASRHAWIDASYSHLSFCLVFFLSNFLSPVIARPSYYPIFRPPNFPIHDECRDASSLKWPGKAS